MIRFAFSAALAAVLSLALPDAGARATPPPEAAAAGPIYPSAQPVPSWNLASEQPHYASVPGLETNRLIQGAGRDWRVLRNGPLSTYGGWLVAVVLAGLFLFYAVKGPVRLHGPPTGRTVRRFDGLERSTHFAMAASFVLLAVTGVIILWGKHLVLPWLGHAAFATVTAGAKHVHNFAGPVFAASILLGFIVYVKDNIPRPADWTWLRHAGGMFSGREVPSGKFNGGEKAWFWIGLVLLGAVLSITGLLLDFPAWDRRTLQVANMVHLGAAVLFIALGLAHAYMGTVGVEGAWRAMREGQVDEAWARQHHSLWYEEMCARPAAPAGATAPIRDLAAAARERRGALAD